jgi:hypothetical protein
MTGKQGFGIDSKSLNHLLLRRAAGKLSPGKHAAMTAAY